MRSFSLKTFKWFRTYWFDSENAYLKYSCHLIDHEHNEMPLTNGSQDAHYAEKHLRPDENSIIKYHQSEGVTGPKRGSQDRLNKRRVRRGGSWPKVCSAASRHAPLGCKLWCECTQWWRASLVGAAHAWWSKKNHRRLRGGWHRRSSRSQSSDWRDVQNWKVHHATSAPQSNQYAWNALSSTTHYTIIRDSIYFEATPKNMKNKMLQAII